ncbi:MAG: transglutaminase-like domain-containing protein [Bdellovibrionota bacterium]
MAGSGDPFTVSTPGTSLEIKVTTFQDYHPQKTHKKIQIRDELLERYVTENVTIPELRLIARMREDLVQEGITKNNSEVDKKRNLKNQIFSTLTSLLTTNSTVQRMLPNGIKDVSTISIHDALYLSGLIVAESLEYCEEMLGNQNQDSGLPSTYSTIDTEDSRNQKAIEIDHQYADEILQQGKGICRNYAPVNQVVFDFLKSKNANLINTYLKTYEPSEIGHMMFLPTLGIESSP